MTTRLEQRVNKLEETVPDMPCPNPEHEGLFVFIKGESEEKDREVDRLIKSLDECEHCRGKDRTVIIHRRFEKPRCPTCGVTMDEKKGEAACNEPH